MAMYDVMNDLFPMPIWLFFMQNCMKYKNAFHFVLEVSFCICYNVKQAYCLIFVV